MERYVSPIDVYLTEMLTQYDNAIMKAVCNVGINVDKEELIKALKYDRDQYKKGYQDALTENADMRKIIHGKWIDYEDSFTDGYYANCSNCGYQMDVHEERGYFNFCPHCGADMRDSYMY